MILNTSNGFWLTNTNLNDLQVITKLDSKDSDKVSGKGQHGGFEGKGLANHFTKAGFAVAWSSLAEEDEGS